MWLSEDDTKNLHKLSQCCWWWCGISRVCFGFDNYRNHQISRPVLHISLTESFRRVPVSWFRQSVNPHPLLQYTLHALLDHFGDCTHHPAGFNIFTLQDQPCTFFIICLMFPILLIIRTWKIAQTVSSSIQCLCKCFFGHFSCRSNPFSIAHIFLPFHNRNPSVFNSLSCDSSLCMHMILGPFLGLFVVEIVRFSACLRWQLRFALSAV